MAGEGSASYIENAQELKQKADAARDAWIAKGPAAPEPSAEPAAPAAPVAPAAVAAPPAPPAAPAAPAPPAPAAPPTAAEVQEFIEALLGEGDKPEVVKIPKGARIPLSVDGQVVYKPLAEVLESGMRLEDYSTKNREVADARRELEEHAARLIADRARMEAHEKWIVEERGRLREAQKSPEAWERYQNHLRMLAEDPDYAKVFEDALMGRERKAEDDATAAARHLELVGESVAQAATWMLEFAKDPAYQYVDLDRVREIYASQLERGSAALDPADVKRIFDAEAEQLSQRFVPLQQEIAELRAQVTALRGGTAAAAAHNATTLHAIERAAAPPVTTGMPPAPAPVDRKVKPFAPRELPEVNREWASRRD